MSFSRFYHTPFANVTTPGHTVASIVAIDANGVQVPLIGDTMKAINVSACSTLNTGRY